MRSHVLIGGIVTTALLPAAALSPRRSTPSFGKDIAPICMKSAPRAIGPEKWRLCRL